VRKEEPVVPPIALPTALPPGRPSLDEKDPASPQTDREVAFDADAGVFSGDFPLQ
jgi:hypothetical protein